MLRRRRPIFIEINKRRVKAPFTMPEGASPADVSLRLRERGWTPYRVYFDGHSRAWIAVVIDWKRVA